VTARLDVTVAPVPVVVVVVPVDVVVPVPDVLDPLVLPPVHCVPDPEVVPLDAVEAVPLAEVAAAEREAPDAWKERKSRPRPWPNAPGVVASAAPATSSATALT
jgi:hypothetical protein